MSNTAEVQNSIMEELNNLTFVKDNAQKLMERKVSFERQRDKKMTVRAEMKSLFPVYSLHKGYSVGTLAALLMISAELHQAVSEKHLTTEPPEIYLSTCVGTGNQVQLCMYQRALVKCVRIFPKMIRIWTLLPYRCQRCSIRRRSSGPGSWQNTTSVASTSWRGNATAVRSRIWACWRGSW